MKKTYLFLVAMLLFATHLTAQTCVYETLKKGYTPSAGSDVAAFDSYQCTSWVSYRINGGNKADIFTNYLPVIQPQHLGQGMSNTTGEACDPAQGCTTGCCDSYRLGNAGQWAKAIGAVDIDGQLGFDYVVNNTPAKGAIYETSSHVAYVEKVWTKDGEIKAVDLTEYNWTTPRYGAELSCGYGMKAYGESIRIPIENLSGGWYIHFPHANYDANATSPMPIALTKPAKPTVTFSNGTATIQWSYSDANASGVQLWKKIKDYEIVLNNGNAYGLSGTTTDVVTPGSNVEYYVKAIPRNNTTHKAANSLSGFAYTLLTPQLTAIKSNGVVFSWANIDPNASYWEVERSLAASFTNPVVLAPNAGSDNVQCGTYYYRMRVKYDFNGDVSTSAYSVPTAGITVTGPPDMVTSIKAVATGLRVNLTWGGTWPATGICKPAFFKVWRKEDNLSYQLLTTTSLPATTLAYSDLAVTGNHKYYYKVEAISASQQSIPISDPTFYWYDTYVLNAPTNLTSSATTHHSVTLNWNDNSNNEGSFQVFVKEVGATIPWPTVPSYLAPGNGSATASFVCEGLLASRAYQFKIRAVVIGQTTDVSTDTAPITVATMCAAPPATATNTLATATGESIGRRIRITWQYQHNATRGTAFVLERRREGAVPVTITIPIVAGAAGNLPPTSYVDNLPVTEPLNTNYYYKVKVVAATANCYSVSESPDCYAHTLAPVTSLIALASANRYEVNLTWPATGPVGHTHYKLQRATTAAGPWRTIDNRLPASATSYTDIGREPNLFSNGVAYFYRISAYATGTTTDSSAYTVSNSTAFTAPAAPTGLTATTSGYSVTLKWTDRSLNETEFKVYRKLATETVWPPTALFNVAANTTECTNDNLTAGTTYHYRIVASNFVNNSAYSNVAAVSTMLPPLAPSAFTATASTTTLQITLKWLDNSFGTRQETGSELQRSTSSAGPWNHVIPIPAHNQTTGSVARSYVDTSGLVEGTTYYYRIQVRNLMGSLFANNIPNATTATRPNAPLNCNAVLAGTTAKVTWVDNSTNEAGFRVYRNGALLASVAANVLVYTDAAIPLCGTDYTYSVVAYNLIKPSAPSNASLAISKPCPPPAAPTTCAASIIGSNTARISWKDNSTNETEFRLYRNGVLLTLLSANTISYIDYGLACSQSYKYYVIAYHTTLGSSAASNTSLAVVGSTCPPPVAPSNCNASIIGSNTALITWQDHSTNETGFRIFRNGILYTSVAANMTSYIDYGLACGTSYNYHVVSYNAYGNSIASNKSLTVSGIVCPKPAAPSNCSVANTGPYSAMVRWADNSYNETGFYIYRNGVYYTTVGANQTSYADYGLACSSSYTYYVVAYNGYGTSAASNTSSYAYGTTCPPPPAPTGLSGYMCNGAAICLSWYDVYNETSYQVYRNGIYIGGTGINGTTFVDWGASCGSNSYYVRAVNSYGGSNSTYLFVTRCCPPSIPTISATGQCGSQCVYISWGVTTNTNSYTVQKKNTAGQWYDATTLYGTTYTDYPGRSTTQYYRVRANGCSYAYSAERSVYVAYRLSESETDPSLQSTDAEGDEVRISPNPMTDEFVLKFTLVEDTKVSAEIVSLTGTLVSTPFKDKAFLSGVHNVKIAASALPSGVHILRLRYGKEIRMKKMVKE